MKLKKLSGIAFFSACIGLASVPANSAENGIGFYPLGLKGPLAGIVPAPGLYFQNDVFLYGARTGGQQNLPTGGTVSVGVRANAVVNIPTLIWSTPYQMLGGRLALGLSAPFGHQSMNADFVMQPYAADIGSNVTAMGDPIITAMLGWDEGNFHWNVSSMVNVPVGGYKEGSLTNVSFNRWAGDFSLAATWFDPSRRWDLSGIVGITFNGKNPVTDYRTGTEFRVEAAASYYVTEQFSIGALGYYYQQISDDSGSGAVLGGYRGRSTALGLTASYNFVIDERPVQTRVKVFREFETQNRLPATTAFLTVSIPLKVK